MRAARSSGRGARARICRMGGVGHLGLLPGPPRAPGREGCGAAPTAGTSRCEAAAWLNPDEAGGRVNARHEKAVPRSAFEMHEAQESGRGHARPRCSARRRRPSGAAGEAPPAARPPDVAHRFPRQRSTSPRTMILGARCDARAFAQARSISPGNDPQRPRCSAQPSSRGRGARSEGVPDRRHGAPLDHPHRRGPGHGQAQAVGHQRRPREGERALAQRHGGRGSGGGASSGLARRIS